MKQGAFLPTQAAVVAPPVKQGRFRLLNNMLVVVVLVILGCRAVKSATKHQSQNNRDHLSASVALRLKLLLTILEQHVFVDLVTRS